ncbi:MAG: type II toxin-antitoxin system Phd/YefM family antitoxin [Candidatus Competibacteraceae bacterium]|nr:type II toxin-antitoxin system Phd/YefM family antitoxin [Candidatus Competibacteraceae bacterium]
MITLNIHEAKTHLSRHLDELQPGESIVLCKRNRPIAEIRLLPTPVTEPRPIGLGKAEFTVPSSFFDPLPEELENCYRPFGSF